VGKESPNPKGMQDTDWSTVLWSFSRFEFVTLGAEWSGFFLPPFFLGKSSRISESEPISAKYIAITYRFFQYLTSIGDMMGLIIKKLTQVPQERFRLR